ncbi:MAG: magnesium-translocating P-type ATPase [Gammaproteobacteria bacterium]|jgi:Mg2+-importing ATPase
MVNNKISSPQTQELLKDLLLLGKASSEQVLTKLNTSLAGLTSQQAETRLEQYGKNEVAHEKLPPWWLQLAKAFITPFTMILFALGITSLFTDVILAAPGEKSWAKVIILATMILLSTMIRFWQEFRSQKAAQKLRELVQNKTLVTRLWSDEHHDAVPSQPGEQREIPISALVPGDIVNLSSGDMIPADIRLLSSKDLFVSQSSLTGESMPIEKDTNLSEAKDNNPLELGNLCFMGTSVLSGFGIGVVAATGNKTYFGTMAKNIIGERTLTSFDKGVNKVSWLLIYGILIMVPIVFLLNALTKHNWHEALFFALAVAVGLTPEMLPMIVSTNLAKGALQMAKMKVIVKKLNAIQNLGAMDILCTDKTGTLTENRIVLMQYLDATGKENATVLNLAYVNSYFQTGLKNIMDYAIIDKKESLQQVAEKELYLKIDEIPFDFNRRRMSVVVQQKGDGDLLICKGAVEEILKLCTHVEENGNIKPITDDIHKQVTLLTEKMNEKGLRVIAVAYKWIKTHKEFYKIEDESELVLSGYIGFLDPPKASAKEAIHMLEEYGITVKVITGDNDIVTQRICQEVALSYGDILLGKEIDKLSDEALAAKVETTGIFAKTDPLQKARIVTALRTKGHTVGYMGDGINDAAAMHAADVSISVDTAVDIAKEAADIILLENDLLVLGSGVKEGRTVFGNIMKYIKMTVSSNFGNVLSVLIASAILPFLPMLALQILIQNLLYDFSQIALPWDKMDEEFLRKPRKWEAKNILRFMFFMGPISSIFDMTTFFIMWFIFNANSIAQQSVFQSGWFIEGLLSQTLIIHMLRTQKIPFIQSCAAKPVVFGTLLIMLIGIIIPFTPFGSHIGLQALPLAYFPWLVGTLVSYCVLTQLVKMWYIKRYKVWL